MYAKITKENLDSVLKDLGNYYTHNGHNKIYAEIILVGGAAVLAKYNFRESSGDMDAIIRATSTIKDAALKVSDKYNLHPDWLNMDFKNTSSFSEKILEHSTYYKTFSNYVEIRIIKPEYLIATKLNAFREYKHDKSDIVGIIIEQEQINEPITKEDVSKAYSELYQKELSLEQLNFFESVINNKDKKDLLDEIQEKENNNLQKLSDFKDKYPNVLNGDNLNEILQSLNSIGSKK